MKYIHVKIYAPLPHTGMPAELQDFAENKGLQDDFSIF